MQAYVVDASIVVQHLIADQFTAHADALFDQIGDEMVLYVPDICLVECTNVLWKEVRFHNLPAAQADALLDDLIDLPVTVVKTTDYLKRALQIGLDQLLAVYDSIYLAIAERLDHALITADVRQANA
jgi:predicted nucleic acid-binding protein